MNKLQFEYYRTSLLQTKRSSMNGLANNAKTLLLLAIFDMISDGKCSNNKIYFTKELEIYYLTTCQRWGNDKRTPIQYPFYYLQSDEYWHITYFKNDVDQPKTPSNKFLLENVDYASFDNALWDMLQDISARAELRAVIIKQFLNNK